MSDREPQQASGNDGHKGAPDGVGQDHPSGRSGGGESQGGAYPNPQSGKDGDENGFLGHGGQTDIGYHGGGQAGDSGKENVNAGTRDD